MDEQQVPAVLNVFHLCISTPVVEKMSILFPLGKTGGHALLLCIARHSRSLGILPGLFRQSRLLDQVCKTVPVSIIGELDSMWLELSWFEVLSWVGGHRSARYALFSGSSRSCVGSYKSSFKIMKKRQVIFLERLGPMQGT